MEKKIDLGMSYDRITDLPEPLKHHILSFLPTKYAVQTSILSSSWRMVWAGLRTLDFSDTYPNKSLIVEESSCYHRDIALKTNGETIVRMREDFYNFLDRAFGLVMELEELKLYVPNFGPELGYRVDHWLACAVGCSVKYLKFKIAKWEGFRYILPGCVLGANSIVKLELNNCELNLSSFMCTQLPSLRELWFDDVFLDEVVMKIIFGICINLESFYLRNCRGLTRLEISNLTPKLQMVDVVLQEVDLEVIKISLPSLLDFSYWYDGCLSQQFCEIDVSGCKNLESLYLNCVQLDDHDLSFYLENLPVLKQLCLTNCPYLEYVEISSERLAHLAIDSCRGLVKVKIHTPNLKSFTYWGENVISLVSKGPALKLEYAIVGVTGGFQTEKWYLGLVKLIAKFSHTEDFSLRLATIQDAVIPENVRLKSLPPLYGVKEMMVEIRVSAIHDYNFTRLKHTPVDLVKCLMWLAPCSETLRICNFDDGIEKLFKFTYEKPLKGKKKCGCWNSLAINCWRHSLTNVSLEYEKGDEDDTQLAEFFRNARIDGKMVDFVKTTGPEMKYRW
ncbi:putative FBD-associated F-box protein At5g56410 [Chenopodium quinoa]|nr:putative FBD-associated F-box protein At5g56410 [Chenopodium quinoa]